MFREDHGSWMTMFFSTILFLFIFSHIYNLFLLMAGSMELPTENSDPAKSHQCSHLCLRPTCKSNIHLLPGRCLWKSWLKAAAALMHQSELKGDGGREEKGSSSDDAVKHRSFDLCPNHICIAFFSPPAAAAAP
ncbi:hypothetical protein ILYODFUR_023446 [Ilyodon furcidens]|uniref:Uncharacterized protein n=1 Tax=Ilyodon furcidens TaxID=33524 RepID=A0ABV0SS44_9TELE